MVNSVHLIGIWMMFSNLILSKANPLTLNMSEHDNDAEDDYLIDWSEFTDNGYVEPDLGTGDLVAEYNPLTHKMSPEELGSYFEGDIMVPQPRGRNGLPNKSLRWPNNKIPYEINGNFTVQEVQILNEAMGQYANYTCIRFTPRKNEKDYVSFLNGNSGCWSVVGRMGGAQPLNLQTPACLTVGVCIHEMLHVVGFMHEQNRAERDDYVSIIKENIAPNVEVNFVKVNSTVAFGVPYDYKSVMHYSMMAFSKNGLPTIIPKNLLYATEIGQRKGFSESDIKKVNLMYNCTTAPQEESHTTIA